MRKDSLIVEKITLLIQTYDLTSGSESRVDSQDALLSYRWRKKKLAKVLSKYPYGLDICLFLCLLDYLI